MSEKRPLGIDDLKKVVRAAQKVGWDKEVVGGDEETDEYDGRTKLRKAVETSRDREEITRKAKTEAMFGGRRVNRFKGPANPEAVKGGALLNVTVREADALLASISGKKVDGMEDTVYRDLRPLSNRLAAVDKAVMAGTELSPDDAKLISVGVVLVEHSFYSGDWISGNSENYIALGVLVNRLAHIAEKVRISIKSFDRTKFDAMLRDAKMQAKLELSISPMGSHIVQECDSGLQYINGEQGKGLFGATQLYFVKSTIVAQAALQGGKYKLTDFLAYTKTGQKTRQGYNAFDLHKREFTNEPPNYNQNEIVVHINPTTIVLAGATAQYLNRKISTKSKGQTQ